MAVVPTQSGIARHEDARMWVHMVQHVLLGMAVPLLLVLSAPLTLALQAANPPTRATLRRGLRSRPAHVVVHPVVAWALFGGGLVAIGPAQEVLERPKHPYAEGLLATSRSLERRDEYLGSQRSVGSAGVNSPSTWSATARAAVWMGVPVVTQSRATAAALGGVGSLNALDLPELVCARADERIEVGEAPAERLGDRGPDVADREADEEPGEPPSA